MNTRLNNKDTKTNKNKQKQTKITIIKQYIEPKK